MGGKHTLDLSRAVLTYHETLAKGTTAPLPDGILMFPYIHCWFSCLFMERKQNKIKTITSFCNLEEKIQSLALRLAFLSDILLCSIYCTHSNIPFLALPLDVFVSPPFLLQAQDKISFCNSPSSLLSFCLIIILPFNLVTIYLCFPRIIFFYTKLTPW